MSKYVSAMELLNCLWKSDFEKIGLSHSAKTVLSILLTYVNKEKFDDGVGYVSWPTSEQITQKCGLKNTALTEAKKELKDKGYIRYHQGKGPRNSNDYYINGSRILYAYNLTWPNHKVDTAAAPFPEIGEKKQKNKNKSNLKVGKDKPVVKETQKETSSKEREIPVQKPQAVAELSDSPVFVLRQQGVPMFDANKSCISVPVVISYYGREADADIDFYGAMGDVKEIIVEGFVPNEGTYQLVEIPF